MGSVKPGNPVSAYLCSVFAYRIGGAIAGRTSLDILLIPSSVMLIAALIAKFLCPPVVFIVSQLGSFIQTVTALHPFLMGLRLQWGYY